MFYLKEDDMDDLLRRAAENYEVDANKAANWEAIQAAVHEPSVKGTAKRKRRFAFWWLLLIPIGWFAHYEWNNLHKAKTAGTAAQTPPDISKEKSSLPYNSTAQEQKTSGSNPINNNASQQNLPRQSVIINKNVIKNNNNNFSLNNKTPQLSKQISGAKIEDQTSIETPNAKRQTINNNQQTTNITQQTTSDTQNNILPRQNPSLPNIILENDTKNDGTLTNAAVTSSGKKMKNTTHYFYAGLIAGPDVSFIKFQRTEAIGINVGLIAGYRFNKFSIETGFLYDKKNYYTTGEYFDKSKIAYFNNAEITSVNGYCNMFEIPLNLRYTFSEKKKHAWFASAGLSSYLMNKEYYDYKYIVDGTARQGGYPYYHATKNWFSVINLSAGYELKTSNKTALRIEPYFKTPVKGVGTGNLSLSSAGLNIGFTKRIP